MCSFSLSHPFHHCLAQFSPIIHSKQYITRSFWHIGNETYLWVRLSVSKLIIWFISWLIARSVGHNFMNSLTSSCLGGEIKCLRRKLVHNTFTNHGISVGKDRLDPWWIVIPAALGPPVVVEMDGVNDL